VGKGHGLSCTTSRRHSPVTDAYKASGPPAKGGLEEIVSVSKNFSETSHQIFMKIAGL